MLACELGGRMYKMGTRNTFSSCPFLCFAQNGQNNVTDGPATSRPDPLAVLAPKGRTEMPRKIFQWRIPTRSSKNTIPASTLATLAYPCTYRTSKSPTSGNVTRPVASSATPLAPGWARAPALAPNPVLLSAGPGSTNAQGKKFTGI